MKKFWEGFEKRAAAFTHATEIGGLGILAAPSIMAMTGKEMSPKAYHAAEIIGLGTLMLPSLGFAGNSMARRIARMRKRKYAF